MTCTCNLYSADVSLVNAGLQVSLFVLPPFGKRYMKQCDWLDARFSGQLKQSSSFGSAYRLLLYHESHLTTDLNSSSVAHPRFRLTTSGLPFFCVVNHMRNFVVMESRPQMSWCSDSVPPSLSAAYRASLRNRTWRTWQSLCLVRARPGFLEKSPFQNSIP